MNDSALESRVAIARAAMRAAYGTEPDEFGVSLFVSHHLTELDASYWEESLGTASPAPAQVIEALVLLAHYGGDDNCDTLDFTLPGEVTNYLVCVNFDANGEIEDISMES